VLRAWTGDMSLEGKGLDQTARLRKEVVRLTGPLDDSKAHACTRPCRGGDGETQLQDIATTPPLDDDMLLLYCHSDSLDSSLLDFRLARLARLVRVA
jgi:hypothetical protein